MRYTKINIVLERVLVLIFNEGVFLRKNVIHLITFSWYTASSVLLLYCGQEGEDVQILVYESIILILLCCPWDLCAQFFKDVGFGKMLSLS